MRPWATLCVLFCLCGCATTTDIGDDRVRADARATVERTVGADGTERTVVQGAPELPDAGSITTERMADGSSRVVVATEPPSSRALVWWVWVGGVCTALGIFLCTPWGGTNVRTGLLCVAGGAGMAAVAVLLPQLVVPGWLLPAALIVAGLWGLVTYYLGARESLPGATADAGSVSPERGGAA